MSSEARCHPSRFSPLQQLQLARDVLRSEGEAVLALAERLGAEFSQAVELLAQCRGNVIVTGMGKAGLVGQKIAATLASTGTSSHFLHPSEAVHGDLGRIHSLDVVLALSLSGETAELTRLLNSLVELKTSFVAVTGHAGSTLGRTASITLELGAIREACCLGLAPTTSTTVMLALGDALALAISRVKGFGSRDFARFHPGGSLGRKLTRIEEAMRPLSECRMSDQSRTVREVLIEVSRPGRRTGAIMLVDERGCLTGLFTDSDLARILEHGREAALDAPIARVMTRNPTTIPPDKFLSDASDLIARNKISELPVVDHQFRPLGLIDITDLFDSNENMSEHPAATPVLPSTEPDAWRAKTVRFPNP